MWKEGGKWIVDGRGWEGERTWEGRGVEWKGRGREGEKGDKGEGKRERGRGEGREGRLI